MNGEQPIKVTCAEKPGDIHPSHDAWLDAHGEDITCSRCGSNWLVLGFFSGLGFRCSKADPKQWPVVIPEAIDEVGPDVGGMLRKMTEEWRKGR